MGTVAIIPNPIWNLLLQLLLTPRLLQLLVLTPRFLQPVVLAPRFLQLLARRCTNLLQVLSAPNLLNQVLAFRSGFTGSKRLLLPKGKGLILRPPPKSPLTMICRM